MSVISSPAASMSISPPGSSEIFAAEQAIGHDRGRGIERQLDIVLHREADLGPVGFRVQDLLGDRPDLDPANPHISAIVQTIDPVELGNQIIAFAAAGIVALIGVEEKGDGDRKNDGTKHGLEKIPCHDLSVVKGQLVINTAHHRWKATLSMKGTSLACVLGSIVGFLKP